jgi:DNA-binding SARP family transcriptional activator/Tfp pilus assembly protein PilF
MKTKPTRRAGVQGTRRDTALLISVFGGVGLSISGKDVHMPNRRARALLAYLALSEARKESRERLAGLFWGDTQERNARSSLRQVLFEARDALSALGCQALIAEREYVKIEADAIDTDLAAVVRQVEEGLVPDALQVQPRAADTLLAGYEDLGEMFEQWIRESRRAIHEKLLRALELGYEKPEMPRRQRRSLAEAALRLDPLHEAACRSVMRLAAEDGELGAALRAYAGLYERLGRELDMEPSLATQELVAQIKQGQFDSAAVATVVPPGAGAVQSTRVAAAGAPIVAVMPFRSIGPDPVPAYFAEGVVEDTVRMLTTLREPVVISSNSTRGFQGQPLDLHHIGQTLGAQYVVSGTLRASGDRLRLSVELAEVARNSVLWSEAYDASEPTLFETQNELAAKIARTLVPRLREAELQQSHQQKPENLTAYHLMIQARDLIFRLERPAFEQARELLRRAIALDPGYAPTHATLAGWHSLRIGQGWSSDFASEARDLETAARSAIELDSGNGRALAMLGHSRTILGRDYAEALSLIDRALAASPNDAEALMWSSPTLAYIGETEEALQRAERAMSLSPQDPFLFRYEHFMCIAYYAAGNYGAAAHWGRRSLHRNSRYTSNLRMTAAALVGLGRAGEARPLVDKVLQLEPGFRVGPMISRQAFQDEGRRAQYGRHLVDAGLPP